MTTKSPSAYVDHNPQKHGNTSHGLQSAITQDRPFRGEMLDLYLARLGRWGFSPNDLAASGIDGDLVDTTAKLAVISDILWGSLLDAAALGQRERWEYLEKRYGRRIGQFLKWGYQLREEVGQAKTIDYQDILAQEEGNG